MASVLKQLRRRNVKIVAVDFDGTLCADRFPEIGRPNKRLLRALCRARKAGMQIILNTCRTGELLRGALVWCHEHGISFDAVNENLPHMIKRYGRDCRKISADVYIDDRAICVRCR